MSTPASIFQQDRKHRRQIPKLCRSYTKQGYFNICCTHRNNTSRMQDSLIKVSNRASQFPFPEYLLDGLLAKQNMPKILEHPPTGLIL